VAGQGQLALRGRPAQADLDAQLVANQEARARNARLAAEVSDLKEGLEMVEEKARAELGMVRPDEILVQVTK
jgi:cell division protein FtsB